MKHHLERPIKLNTQSKYESLYKWSVIETAEDGKESADFVPWDWRIQYTAAECTLSDALTLSLGFALKKEDREPSIEERQSIRIRLRPGYTQPDGKTMMKTRHSMLGTGRNIDSIWLNIYSHSGDEESEVCQVWGSVSYTMEIDFRNETEDDTLQYNILVKKSTFERYTDKIKNGCVDIIYFSVCHVTGFYSEWSPSISTNSIKILTADKDHKIDGDHGKIEIPRLREVGDWSLSFVRRPILRDSRQSVANTNKTQDEGVEQLAESPALVVAGDQLNRSHLQSIKSAAWLAVGLLAILVLKAVLH